MSYDPMKHCTACHCELEEEVIDVSRSVQRTYEVDADSVETDIKVSEGFGLYCDACGAEAALAELSKRGLTCIVSEPDPETPICARCQRCLVPEDRWHVVYEIQRMWFDATSGTVLDDMYRAPVCTSCESPDERMYDGPDSPEDLMQ